MTGGGFSGLCRLAHVLYMQHAHVTCMCMHKCACICWARVQVFVFWRAARAHRRASRSEAAALRDALRFVAAARSPPRDPSTHHHAVCRPQRTRMRCERSSR